jgi:hypothetical protein
MPPWWPHDVDPASGQLEQIDCAPAAAHDTLELTAASLLDDPEPAEVDDVGHDAPGRFERHRSFSWCLLIQRSTRPLRTTQSPAPM